MSSLSGTPSSLPLPVPGEVDALAAGEGLCDSSCFLRACRRDPCFAQERFDPSTGSGQAELNANGVWKDFFGTPH